MRGLNSGQNRELRENVRNRHDGRCAYCGVGLSARRGTVDHYLPLALGGGNELGNLRWCCVTCNGLKADMRPQEWEARRPARQAQETKHQRRNRLLADIARRARCALGEKT